MLHLDHPLTAHIVGALLDVPVLGASDTPIYNIGSLADYDQHSLIFSNHKNIEKTAACLISTHHDPLAQACIVVANPKLTMQKLLNLIDLPSNKSAHTGIHATAVISKQARIGNHVTIGPFSVVEEGAQIGDHSVISSHVHIMQHAILGRNCHIESGAVIYPHASLGEHVHIGAKTVLGDAGFGYDWDNGWVMFPQIGRLIIGDHVHIGPQSVIDRGALQNTVIGSGCKLDAKMMIGHGVTLGKNVIMAACGAIGGSSQLGDMTMAGGCVSIADHVTIASGTRLSGGCNVASSIRMAGEYASGMPAMTSIQWRRWLRFVLRAIRIPTSTQS